MGGGWVGGFGQVAPNTYYNGYEIGVYQRMCHHFPLFLSFPHSFYSFFLQLIMFILWATLITMTTSSMREYPLESTNVCFPLISHSLSTPSPPSSLSFAPLLFFSQSSFSWICLPHGPPIPPSPSLLLNCFYCTNTM